MGSSSERAESAAIKAVDRLFGDSSVPASETRASLLSVREHIDELIASLGQHSKPEEDDDREDV